MASNKRHLPDKPYDLRDGETARQIVLAVLASSATTKLVFRGSRPLSTHSTEA